MPDPARLWAYDGPALRRPAPDPRPRPSVRSTAVPRGRRPRRSPGRQLARWIPFCVALAVVVTLSIVRGVIASRPAGPVFTSGPGLPPGTDLLLGDGRVFDVGDDGTLNLASASGKVLWSAKTGNDVIPVTTGPYAVPQLGAGCVTVMNNPGEAEIASAAGRSYRTLDNLGYPLVNGARTAWSDGTIRDSCTGRILSHFSPANPEPYGNPPECLAGSVVIRQTGTWSSPDGLQGWRNRSRLWHRSGQVNVVCDGDGTAALLDRQHQTVDLVSPETGKPAWKAPQPAGVTGSLYQLFETPGTVILSSGSGAVRAFDKKTGKLLWSKTGTCALAVRTAPRPEALLGPCTSPSGTSPDDGEASVVNAANGSGATTLETSPSADQWSANSDELLGADTSDGTVQETRW